MPNMNTEEINAFLSQPNDAIIAVNRADKGAQLTPVWFFWDGEAFYISTDKGSAKYLNMMRDPNISFIVNDSATYTYVTAYGKAKFFTAAEINIDLMHLMMKKYIPEDKQAQYANVANNASKETERVFIVLHPEKIFGVASRF